MLKPPPRQGVAIKISLLRVRCFYVKGAQCPALYIKLILRVKTYGGYPVSEYNILRVTNRFLKNISRLIKGLCIWQDYKTVDKIEGYLETVYKVQASLESKHLHFCAVCVSGASD